MSIRLVLCRFSFSILSSSKAELPSKSPFKFRCKLSIVRSMNILKLWAILYSFKFIVNLRSFISSMILRLFQAKPTPGTVHTVTMVLNFCHTETIRVFLKTLNASDKVCYINLIIFQKIITSQLFLQVPPFYFYR